MIFALSHSLAATSVTSGPGAVGLTTPEGAQDLEITQRVAPSNQLIRAAPGVTG